MNPSSTKLMSPDVVQDQSSSKGLSNTIKKQTKGKNILDLLGGVGSFATILKKSGSILSIEKNGDGKERSIHTKGKLTVAKDDTEKELPGNTSMQANKGFVVKKEDKIAGNESAIRKTELSPGGEMKKPAEANSSNAVLFERTEKKFFPGKLENSQFMKGEKSVDAENALDITKALHGQQIDSTHNESTLEPGNTVSLMKDIPGANGVKKSAPGEATIIEDESRRDVKPSITNAAKENIPTKQYMPEDIKLVRTGDESKDQRSMGDVDLSKGFEIKAAAHKVSSDTKEREMLLKGSSLNPEVVKENTIPTNRANQVNEVTQEYKNLFTHGRPSEKPVEGSTHESMVAKTESFLWTVQADLSGAKSVGNYGLSSTMNADMNTSVQFQNILDQIEDTAAQMVKKGPGRIVLTLEPPNLGALNVDVKVHNDMVRLVLVADNHEVKQVLQTNLDQLKTALQDQGLTMDRFDVLVQQRSSENPGFQQWGGAHFGEEQGKRENTKEHSAPPQPLTVHGDDVNEPYMGMISLFA